MANKNNLMNNNIDISVIIPVYNSQETIKECIDSVVNECINSDCLWELILVNDGSTDDSTIKIAEYINKSPFKDNIILINQKNGGAAKARNTGIKASRGEFIAFNDSDDAWVKGKLSAQLESLTNNKNIDLLAGTFGRDNLSKIKKVTTLTHITIKDQVLKNYFSPPTSILRSRILKKSGLFNEDMRHAEEGYFFNNIVYTGEAYVIPMVVTRPITTKERWGDCGLSGNIVAMEKGELFNISTAYKNKYISLWLFIFAYCFSIAKFFRRYIIKNIRKYGNKK